MTDELKKTNVVGLRGDIGLGPVDAASVREILDDCVVLASEARQVSISVVMIGADGEIFGGFHAPSASHLIGILEQQKFDLLSRGDD